MRMTFAIPVLALTLSGCGAGVVNTAAGPAKTPDQVCAEQSVMATQGRTDGREIIITCP